MKKAYDRVDIEFLLEILQARSFNSTWIGWIKKIITVRRVLSLKQAKV
jgi:hypothetical protein